MKIYRKRYIPNEIVDISNDRVILLNDELMVTEWIPINPRSDMSYGKSYTFFKKGWKISKFLNENRELICWYCDIIETHIENDEYTLTDLLVDELDEAVSHGLISEDKKEEALEKMNELLEVIKRGEFPPKECK